MKWALKPIKKLMQEALEEFSQNEDDFQDLFENEDVKIIQISKKSILTLILVDVADSYMEFYEERLSLYQN